MLPLVALVGRPNVGKSTLFNKIVGRRLAIVEDTPGVTRDRQYAEADHGDRRFLVVDAEQGLAGSDRELAALLRKGGKPVLLAANKVDSTRRADALDLGEL